MSLPSLGSVFRLPVKSVRSFPRSSPSTSKRCFHDCGTDPPGRRAHYEVVLEDFSELPCSPALQCSFERLPLASVEVGSSSCLVLCTASSCSGSRQALASRTPLECAAEHDPSPLRRQVCDQPFSGTLPACAPAARGSPCTDPFGDGQALSGAHQMTFSHQR